MNADRPGTVDEIEPLVAWRNAQAAKAISSGGEAFMGLPDAWYEDAHYGCLTGHVSRTILTGDSGDRCLACLRPVVIIPPMSEPEFARICRHVAAAAQDDGS
jgi:hypothetical protein